MKKIYTLCLCMVLSVVVYSQTKKIAFLEPRIAEGSTEVSAMEKNMVRGELRKAIVNASGYEAFTREDIDQIMKEQNFQRTGMVSNEQIKQLGELSGADYICISTLTKSSTEFYLEAYLINVENGGISNPGSQYGELVNGKLANMLPVCKKLAEEIVGLNGESLSDKNVSKTTVEIGDKGVVKNNEPKNKIVEDNNASSPTNVVTDCQGHSYPVVKIGDQYWMAENLQCTKYDSQSERSGAVLATSDSWTYAPYYTDGRYAKTKHCESLTQEHRKHLGLFYNWAAAMGYLESQVKSQKRDYNGLRQGICPNGWHLPNKEDWKTLVEYCGGSSTLKSKTGWYKGGNGTDAYEFNALPSGSANASSVSNLGEKICFWTTDSKSSEDAVNRYMSFGNSLIGEEECDKDHALSVRCVKN